MEEEKKKILEIFESSFNIDENIESSIESAVPIWEILNLTEKEYNEKYNSIKEEKEKEEEK